MSHVFFNLILGFYSFSDNFTKIRFGCLV